MREILPGAMSRGNVETLRRVFEAAADTGRVEDLLAILDEDIVWDPGGIPSRKTYGHEGVLSFFRHWVGTFEEWRFEVVELRECGNAVFVHMHQWGRGRGSGVATEIDLWQVWLFFEGKVVRFVQKPSREKALEAAGLEGLSRGT